MNQPEVVIVGGGIIGASVAYELASNHRVLLIEQGSQSGLGATAQNAGLLRRMRAEPTERALARQTFDFFKTADRSRVMHKTTGAVLASHRAPLHLHGARSPGRRWRLRSACRQPRRTAPRAP